MDSDTQQILVVQQRISPGHRKLLSTFRAAVQRVLHAPRNDNFPTIQQLLRYFNQTLISLV